MLARINRELGADFNLDTFAHEARWNEAVERIEMHLCSRVAQAVHIPALGFTAHFAMGETIHTENSYKFTDERILTMLRQAGFSLRRKWKDERGWFAVYLAEAC